MKKVVIKRFSHAEVDAKEEQFGFLKIPSKHEILRAEGEDLEVSDGYHTFDELYEFRKLYNAAFFNSITIYPGSNVHKSKKHSDGEDCFGGGWFIVMATLPSGQISNHYELKDWDLFTCEVKEKADEWDGHTPKDVMERLKAYSLQV